MTTKDAQPLKHEHMLCHGSGDIPADLVPLDSRPIVVTEIEAMGGAERSVLALSRWLLEHDLPHHFVTYIDHIDMAAHAHHPIAMVQLRPEMRAIKKVAALRRHFASKPWIYQPLMSGYQAAMHGALTGLNGFHTLMHDTPSLFGDIGPPTPKQRMMRFVSNQITAYGLQSGGRTIVTSEYLRAETREVFGVEADIARMGGLSGADGFRSRVVDGELRMLSVSRVERNKRVDWMLRSLAAMENDPVPLSARINWRLDVAGKGSLMDPMKVMAAELGIADRVRFLGYVSDEELEKLYDSAHLFLMPAVQGYGIPAIEALANGLPVLVHRESGVSDILLSTPWATVIEGGEQGMLPGMRTAIETVIAGAQMPIPPPPLPTEAEWAERVAKLCGWLRR